jgi:hypothetical protein
MASRRKRRTRRSRPSGDAAAQRITLLYIEQMLRALADLVRKLADGGN